MRTDDDRPVRPLRDELTAAMHAEFTISEETEIILRAGCIWDRIYYNKEIDDFDLSEEEIRRQAKSYGISYEDAIQHKDYWLVLVKKSIASCSIKN